MQRSLELARLGKKFVSPNPMVGAVIVFNNRIIGEGFHQRHGGPHAEVNAINSVKNKELLKESTIYVSLEPCSHFGKTPPCADLIIAHKIPRVVIASVDSNAVVCGNGITKLKQAGIEVITGVLEMESNQLNKAFNCYHQEKRPFVILKWAQTKNGFIDQIRTTSRTKALSISNNESSRWVHKLRSEVDAILIGKTTALLDNPSLTTRLIAGESPIRVVLDFDLKLPSNLRLFTDGGRTIVLNQMKSIQIKNLEYVQVEDRSIKSILEVLFTHQILSVLVEGGTNTLQQFIDAQLYDEAFVIKSDMVIKSGVKAPTLNTNYSTLIKNRTDQIFVYD